MKNTKIIIRYKRIQKRKKVHCGCRRKWCNQGKIEQKCISSENDYITMIIDISSNKKIIETKQKQKNSDDKRINDFGKINNKIKIHVIKNFVTITVQNLYNLQCLLQYTISFPVT